MADHFLLVYVWVANYNLFGAVGIEHSVTLTVWMVGIEDDVLSFEGWLVIYRSFDPIHIACYYYIQKGLLLIIFSFHC